MPRPDYEIRISVLVEISCENMFKVRARRRGRRIASRKRESPVARSFEEVDRARGRVLQQEVELPVLVNIESQEVIEV
jgi:hypothetical protein